MTTADAVQILLGALADIGNSGDMTLLMARKKAVRIHREVTEALEAPADAIECGWCDGRGWLAPDDPAFTVGRPPT